MDEGENVLAAAPPKRSPVRRRRRVAPHPEPPASRPIVVPEIPAIDARPESGSGSFGGGTFDDDDDDGRRPDRGDDGRRPLLVALALLVLGAGVMSARLLARPRTRSRG